MSDFTTCKHLADPCETRNLVEAAFAVAQDPRRRRTFAENEWFLHLLRPSDRHKGVPCLFAWAKRDRIVAMDGSISDEPSAHKALIKWLFSPFATSGARRPRRTARCLRCRLA
jgi:hypothetical protein